MMKRKTAVQIEEKIYQQLLPYFTTAINSEIQHLLKKGERVYIYIEGFIVSVEQVFPLEIDFVVPTEDIELTENFFKKVNNKNRFFKAIDHNMLQRIF